MSSSSNKLARRVYLSRDHLADLDKEQLAAKWLQQEAYINQLENAVDELGKQADSLQHELQSNETKNKKRLHNICMKLTLRDRKINQLQEKLDLITQNQLPTSYQLESTLIDPALNMMFEKMKKEMEAAKIKVDEMQNELSAWKFTPDSTTGKRLMAKCRLLHNENEELGREMSTGWVAQLNGNLALQKKFSEEMKKSQTELDEFLLELEEEVEGMQNTIYYLQRQVKELKEKKASSSNQFVAKESTTDHPEAHKQGLRNKEEPLEVDVKLDQKSTKPGHNQSNLNEQHYKSEQPMIKLEPTNQ